MTLIQTYANLIQEYPDLHDAPRELAIILAYRLGRLHEKIDELEAQSILRDMGGAMHNEGIRDA